MALYAGSQITNSSDKLMKISDEYLYHKIKNPSENILAKIRYLRIIHNIDIKRYSVLKKELPYIVCGCFNPPFRRTENFAFINSFIIDIDNITQKGLSIESIKNQLVTDNRILMLFISPSQDGLKVIFRLSERCYDSGIYSLFYKVFVKQLSEQYNLNQVIDTKTCDVSRACFISWDPDIYYNESAESININNYVNTSSDIFLKEKSEMERIVKNQNDSTTNNSTDSEKDPGQESIIKIKEILKLRKTKQEKTPIYIPDQLLEIMDDLKAYIEEYGIQVSEIISISYGKKIRMKLNNKESEVNVFYGKKGFTVVQSPRCGTNTELNQLTSDIIDCFFS